MRFILPIIVISQFLCTSLWFAGNAVVADLMHALHLQEDFIAHITSAIQLGFICGTFVFALFTLSDRFSPSLIFFISAVIAAACNLGIIIHNPHPSEILLFRFLTGFFLAGIYPVGMKIASDYYREGLGKSLGFLVGALVLGTAFPHLLKSFTAVFPWKSVLVVTSALSVIGGLGIFLLVPDGPYRKPGQTLKFNAFLKGFKNMHFRSAALGYFGHMWELYAFWAFLPVMLKAYTDHYSDVYLNVPLWSFLIIGSGGLACVLSGMISQRYGAKKIATLSLSISCACCLLSPLLLFSKSAILLIIFLFIWGLSVIADSPLFSTLVARNAPEVSRGTALTIVNCIGFSITILSIQCISFFTGILNAQYLYLLLAIGPILGLIALLKSQTHKV